VQQTEDNLDDVADPNRPYADEPAGFGGRAGRWFVRLAGQARRQYLSRLRKGYVKRARGLRRGTCRACGACCDLTFHCPYLDDEKPTDRCTHYEKRTLTCRDFPIDARDLELTRVPCGHYFETETEAQPVRFPLTKYGAREIVVFGGVAAAAIVLSAIYFWYVLPLFVAALLFVLYFFRDPERQVPQDPGVLVAPADGKIVEIGEAEKVDFLDGPACRISIFMSPLDVHVNRSPCAGKVVAVAHRPGRFLHAESPQASAENESNAIAINKIDGNGRRILVRQVAGVVARRIVCDASVGDRLERGQRIGMVKFGSRAEVYVPTGCGFQVAVEVGQRVKAGETILGAFRP